MDIFSDSLIGFCNATSTVMHVDFVSKSVSQAEKKKHAIRLCTSQENLAKLQVDPLSDFNIPNLLKRVNSWDECLKYDAFLTVEKQSKETGKPIIVGALFLEMKDETHAVLELIEYPTDMPNIDMLLLLMASEIAGAYGCKQLVHNLIDSSWNHMKFRLYYHKMNFFWLDADGNATNETAILSKKKRTDGNMRPCYKLCRPKFTFSNPNNGVEAVYFAKCLMNERERIATILRKGRLDNFDPAYIDWDVVISYGDSCKIFMRKTKDENVYDVYHRGDDLENKQGVIREAAVYDCKSEDVRLNFIDDGI
jgi:hypothetical protein